MILGDKTCHEHRLKIIPTLLGVMIDKNLTFKKHIDDNLVYRAQYKTSCSTAH